MTWFPWSRKAARESVAAFTPVVVAGEQESPRPQSPQSPYEREASSRSHFALIWKRSNASTRATSSSRTAAGSPLIGPFHRRRADSADSEMTRTWRSEQSRSRSVHPGPELRRHTFTSEGSGAAWRGAASPSPSKEWTLSTRPFREPSSPRRRCLTQPPLTMDEMFDTVSAQLRSDEATLEKSGSEERGGLVTRDSSPVKTSFMDSFSVKTSFMEPPRRSKPSRPQEPAKIRQPMTKAEVLAWKAKNDARSLRKESEEGIDMRARPPQDLAKRLEMIASGDHSDVPAACAFWSLEANVGSD